MLGYEREKKERVKAKEKGRDLNGIPYGRMPCFCHLILWHNA